MSTATPINTKSVTDRREIHFANFDEVLADAERLAAGPHHNKLSSAVRRGKAK